MVKSQIVELARAALETPSQKKDLNIDFDALYMFAEMHQTENLLFYGLANREIKDSGEKWNEFYNRICKNIYISEMQQYEAERIFNAFEAEKIEYMPLKGIVLKRLYSKADMRTMSDLDVLIKEKQYAAISSVMKSLGYTEFRESDHEIVWSDGGFVCVEFHKRLIPSYNKDYYAFYGDGWDFAQKVEGSSRYNMKPEDEYVYLFTHMAKHYRDSGVGIKQVIDLWVHRQKYPTMNNEYIEKCLSELNLDVFHKNICRLLDVWMNDGEHNEITEKIMDFIFNSGVYGTSQNQIMSNEVKSKSFEKSGRVGLLVKKVFKPMAFMKKRYPILRHLPFLLPFMWIIRIFDTIINKRERFSDLYEKLSPKEIKNYKKELESVGLAYNFDV